MVGLVTTLLLVPGFSFRVADQLLTRGATQTNLLPPVWFAGLHDMMSGHIWAELPRPDLPPRIVESEGAFEAVYQSRRPLLHELGVAGGGSFLAILLVSAAAYLWNNRRLPDPPSPRTTARGSMSAIFDGIAQRLLVRRPLVRAGFFFTVRVLARSVQNRLSIAIPLAVAVAVGSCHFAAGTRVHRWTSRAFRLRCWRFSCCLSRHWSLAFVIPFACRQICAPGGSFISYGPPITPRIWQGSNGP